MAVSAGGRWREVFGVDDGQRLHGRRRGWDRRFGEPGFPGLGVVVSVLVVSAIGGGVLALGSGETGSDALVLVALVIGVAIVALVIASVLSPRHRVRPPVSGEVSGSAGRDAGGGVFARWDRANQDVLEEARSVSHEDDVSWGGSRRARARLVIAAVSLAAVLVVATVAALIR